MIFGVETGWMMVTFLELINAGKGDSCWEYNLGHIKLEVPTMSFPAVNLRISILE